MPFVRRLTLFPDILVATRGLCLHQQDECEEQDCRHHLGAIRTYLGDQFGCAVAVALAYPHGLAPVAVAELLGVGEGIAQITERGAYDKVRLELSARRCASGSRWSVPAVGTSNATSLPGRVAVALTPLRGQAS